MCSINNTGPNTVLCGMPESMGNTPKQMPRKTNFLGTFLNTFNNNDNAKDDYLE